MELGYEFWLALGFFVLIGGLIELRFALTRKIDDLWDQIDLEIENQSDVVIAQIDVMKKDVVSSLKNIESFQRSSIGNLSDNTRSIVGVAIRSAMEDVNVTRREDTRTAYEQGAHDMKEAIPDMLRTAIPESMKMCMDKMQSDIEQVIKENLAPPTEPQQPEQPAINIVEESEQAKTVPHDGRRRRIVKARAK